MPSLMHHFYGKSIRKSDGSELAFHSIKVISKTIIEESTSIMLNN